MSIEKIEKETQNKEGEKNEINKIAYSDLKKEISNSLGIENKTEISILARIDEVSGICSKNKNDFGKICEEKYNLNFSYLV